MKRYPVVKIEWSEIDRAFLVYIDGQPVTHGDTIEDAIKYLSEVMYLHQEDSEKFWVLSREAPDVKDAATVEYVTGKQTEHMSDDYYEEMKADLSVCPDEQAYSDMTEEGVKKSQASFGPLKSGFKKRPNFKAKLLIAIITIVGIIILWRYL